MGACALLAAAGFAIYGRTIPYPFLYDDDSFIVQNAGIRSLTPFKKFFLDPDTQASDPQLARDVYRPLTTLSHALSHRLWGADPRPYHAVNVSLHAINGVLVFALLLLLLPHERPGRRAAAFLGALLFVVHPVQTEAVAWVSQRSILLSQAFFLLALLAYLRHRSRPAPLTFAAALFCFALSLLCKESAVVYPAIVALLGWYLGTREGEAQRSDAARAGDWLLPASTAVLAGGYVLARSAVLGQVAQTHYWAGGFYKTCLLMAKGFAYYLRLLFLPHPLSIEYLFEVPRTFLDPLVLVSLSVLGAAGCAAWHWRKSRPLISLGIAWFFVSLAPVSNIIPIRTIINERFLYLPIIGLCLVVAHLTSEVLRRGARLRSLAALATVSLAALSLLSVHRVKDWSSGFALASSAIRTCPQSARIRYGMGRQYAERGEYDKALKEFETALSIDPAYHEALNDIGLIAQRRGDLDAALGQYRKSLQAKVDYPEALYNMGNAYFAKRDYAAAVRAYEGALKSKPGDADIRSNLAAAYAYGRDLAKAVELSLAVLKEEPGREKTRHNLALFQEALAAEELLRPRQTRTAAVLQGFRRDPRLRLAARGDYELVRDASGAVAGVRPKPGYLGSAQAVGALKPQECQALKALAARKGPRVAAAQASFLFPLEYGTPYVIRAGEAAVRVRPLHANKVRLSNVEGLVAYERAFQATNVLFNSDGGSAEEFLLLEDASAPRTFEYALEPEGSVAVLSLDAGGALRAEDAAGGQVFGLSAPVVFDAKGKTARGRFALARHGRGYLLAMSFDAAGLEYPVLIDPTWTTIGSPAMSAARSKHTATLLPSGKVLVTGGAVDGLNSLSSAEIYDPLVGTWTTTGDMNEARQHHTATLLPNGKVLVAGGLGGLGGGNLLTSAELYDPSLGAWSTTNSLNFAREKHTATLLTNGKVLVTGGYTFSGDLSSAELYDPSTGIWTTTNNMNSIRSGHTATLLPDGKVMIAGGYGPVATAEIYDAAMGTWATANGMNAARYGHVATLLPNGKVLVSGGGWQVSSAELYDPASGTWTTTNSMNSARQYYPIQ